LSVSVDGDTIVVGAYVFTRSGTTWIEQQNLTASDAAVGNSFGRSVSIDGDTIVVGAYVFTRSGTTWTEQQKLTASDAAVGDGFGSSVSVDGDTIVVGATGDDDGGWSSGSAYVFTRSGTTWTEQQKLTASDAAGFNYFGWSVSIDGDTIVVSTRGDESLSSAYVFTRSGTTWTEQQKLTASDAAAGDCFGWSVSVDGDMIVVGAWGDDSPGSAYVFTRSGPLIGDDRGSAYVFTRSGTTWTEQQELTASDAAADDYFGSSVSVDRDTIVVGATGDDDGGWNSGSAYVFASQVNILIPLNSGWNLISVPLNIDSWQLVGGTDPLPVCVSYIVRYNSETLQFEMAMRDGDSWLFTGPSFELEPGMGYWAWAEEPCTLIFTGTEPSGFDMHLNHGWNLIGWYSTSTAPLISGADPLPVCMSYIVRYNSTTLQFEMAMRDGDSWLFTGPSFELKPGMGYWAWVDTEGGCDWDHE
jgi:hypothetical protein